jgi:hypothetical protein
MGIACSRRAGNIGIWDSAPATTTVDDNVVWLSTTDTVYAFAGVTYTSLAAVQQATGQEQHGIQADPAFVNPLAWNLQLKEDSPAIDSANSAAPGEQSTDILGNPRTDDPNAPNTGTGPSVVDDRGAYEFQPNATQPNTPAAALTVTPAVGKTPLPITADASASTDPQGQALTYLFAFGDGTTAGPQVQPTATHTYSTPGTFTVTVTVTDTSGLSSAAGQLVTSTAPNYVGQIANNCSTAVHTSGYVSVWRTAGVRPGDLMVITLMLSGTTTGPVSGTDDAGDQLTVAADITDQYGHRLVVLAGTASQGLTAGQKITTTFPTATEYRMLADEVAAATTLDQHSAAAGDSTTFSSGPTAQTSSPFEFVLGTVAIYAGSAPTWATGWTGLSSYQTGSDYTGRAYRTTTTTGSFTATGTATGTWLATTVTFS